MELQILVMIAYGSLTCFRVLAADFWATRFISTILLTEPKALLRLLNTCPILDTSLDSESVEVAEISADPWCHLISKNIALKLTACRPKLNLAQDVHNMVYLFIIT